MYDYKKVIKGIGCMTIKGYKRIRMHGYKGL